jgi:hypothetical protein
MKAKMSILPVAMMGGTGWGQKWAWVNRERSREKCGARQRCMRAAARPREARLTCLAARAGDEVHHPLGKAVPKDLHGGDVRCTGTRQYRISSRSDGDLVRVHTEAADVGELHHHRVAHENRGDEGGVGFVEWVVEWP